MPKKEKKRISKPRASSSKRGSRPASHPISRNVASASESLKRAVAEAKIALDEAQRAAEHFRLALHEGLAISGDAIQRAASGLESVGLKSISSAVKKAGHRLEKLAG